MIIENYSRDEFHRLRFLLKLGDLEGKGVDQLKSWGLGLRINETSLAVLSLVFVQRANNVRI